MKQVTARQVLILLLAVWMTRAAWEEEDARFKISAIGDRATGGSRWCTPDELLPRQAPAQSLISPEWSAERVQPPYGCDCSFYKTRYFCPSLGDEGYPAWVPQAVADGVCKTVTRSDLRRAPLPPGFKVSFYGNSYLRQAVEGFMCMFHDKVKTKRVRYRQNNLDDGEDRTVPGDTVCRECWGDRPTLRSRGCLSEEGEKEGCPCSDDFAEYEFENGAIVHFYFANVEGNKSPSDSLAAHGSVPWSWYDAVVANQGNPPALTPDDVLATATELQELSVPFFWLNTYEGRGEVGSWGESQRSRFQELGAKHVKIDAMVLGMRNMTKGAVEHSPDPHFCLPGPPDEMSLLLAKMLWAVYFETTA